MELGVLGLDGVGSLSLDGEASKQKWATRSGGYKQEGSGFGGDDWRASKVAKSDGDFSLASTALLLQNTRSLPLKNTSTASDPNMLSFSSSSSSSKSETSALPYFHQMAAAHAKNTGYYSGALNTSNGMYLLSGVSGQFTPSQWLELEQQALIYKYITANEPIPAQLLIPIRKALESAGLFGFNGATTLRPTSWGWGTFHLGYSNSNDPEPGRCRRTDGKKWRCSRDAVADQKYCERHMNRGRHRSRKHVEGQGNGHSGSGATKSSTTKLTMPSAVASPSAAFVAPGGGSSNSFDMNRMLVNRENNGQGLQDTTQFSFLSPSGPNVNLNCCESSFSIPKHQNPYEESALSAFGQHSIRAFVDDWPKNQVGADRSSILWPGLQSQSDSTQLSMGLGVGSHSQSNRQASWIPTSWEASSMGGPLGEVLQSSSNIHCSEEGQKASPLNLLPKGWGGTGSYQLSSSSPTGVLQKSALVSLSNSSAGSSPRADNSKTIESGGTLAQSSSLPALD